MFDSLQIIDEHEIIRETVGYDIIKETNIIDLPAVLSFLQIVHNYIKMTKILEK